MYRILPARVGRRGTCLLAIAVLYLLGGITQYVQPPVTRVTLDQMRFIYAVASPRVWAVLWMTVGVFALAGAFVPRIRSAAYGAVLMLLGVWTIGIGIAAVLGAYRAFLAVAIYGCLLLLFEIISGWHECNDHHRHRWHRGP